MSRAKKRAQMERVDALRRRSTPARNQIIDEYSAGKMTRREFLRRGSILGMSLPMMGFLASACSPEGAATTTTAAAGTTLTTAAPGTTSPAPSTTGAPAGPTTVRAAFFAPAGPIDPVLANDEGRLAVLGQTAQYLTFSDAELNLRPVLAESWEPNETFDVWTFNLRQGVLYHDGSEVVADDVVASIRGIAEGNAASAFGTFGVTPDSVSAVDQYTVQFTLERPSGSFPFFVSSDNYNAVILPTAFWEGYAEGSYEAEFPGSGPWVMESHEPGVSAAFVKNENYWDDNSGQPDRLELLFFADEAPAVTAFQEGRIDAIPHVSFSGGQAIIDTPDATTSSISTAQHRQIYFDTSAPPFEDVRVRQAIALTLDRQTLIDGLVGGFGVIGNDHPIWSLFPVYNPDAVAQREADLATAQQLLDAAGFGDGLEAPLDVLEFFEVEDLAQLVQASAAQLNGVNLTVGVYDAGTYYEDYWLAAASSMGIVNYGHRGVPDVYLGAPLLSDGTWNASHWVNETYDDLFSQYSQAPDLDTQRSLAGEIQTLLNEEVPFMVPYFVDHISVTKPNFTGMEVTGMGHVNLVQSGFSS
ncbi:MAG TPA: ABC transporter substrate-binding protein [Acidimicrobiia bacterium]|nr:ABC transporter substrate-binding protein [Acidimicrobiia bacterium]